MPVITLPDGSERSFENPVTVQDIAASIGSGLAKATLAGRVDGKLVDASHLVEEDANIAIVTSRDEEALELMRHDAAHVMAQAVQELYPGTQVTIGPAIEDGFYYDFARDEPFTPDDLKKIAGLGPVLEQKLNDMGIFHYWQLAVMGDEDMQKIDDELTLHGRIGRDDWISQARRLAEVEAE